MNRQTGNVLLWLVLGVVAAGLGVFIVWRYFEATNPPNEPISSETSTTVALSERVSIKEWGVSFGVPESLRDKQVRVEYQPSVNGKPDATYYLSKILDTADNSCLDPVNDKDDSRPFAIITRTHKDTPIPGSGPLADQPDFRRVGEWNYFITMPSIGSCYDPATIQPFMTDAVRAALIDSVLATE